LLLLADDDGLVELRLDRPGAASHVGDIHLGRIQRVEKGLDAAFVELGLERPALLAAADHDGPFREGDSVLVQVTRDARDGKGAKLTGRPVLAGRHVVYDPFHPGIGLSQRLADRAAGERLATALRGIASADDGFVVRGAAAGAPTESVLAEAARLRAAWRALLSRRATAKPPVRLHREDPVVAFLRDAGPVASILVDSRAGADALRIRLEETLPELAPLAIYRSTRELVPSMVDIDDAIAAALDAEVALPGGGSLLIEPGRTLTVIDVNSGGGAIDGTGRQSGERRLLDTNLAAATAIARQLRLRNLGGIVVIDFIDLKSADARTRVIEALKAATADDPSPCRVGQMSRLGLVEMTRRRRGPSLAEMLTAPCAACDGAGRVPVPLAGTGRGEAG
jgi:ribonuclease G